MTQERFITFLLQLGYSEEDIAEALHGDTFSYRKQLSSDQKEQLYYKNDICVKYIYISEEHFEQRFFEKHTDIWNENDEHVFVVVSEQTTYLINAKVKPNLNSPLHKSITIDKPFAYGVNSEGFAPEELRKLRATLGKESIDSAYFFDFIIEKTKRQKTSEVDKDLLLNLIQLRNDLLKTRGDQETIHLLILRCLFIKYLEDRGIYEKNYLINILKTRSAQQLIDAFEQIRRINGDIFKYDKFSVSDIHSEYLEKLERFFYFDYRSGQGYLFPYKFEKIPIQLISHVYEAFLSNTKKGNKGIYYTPSFVVKFMLSHTVLTKLQEKKDVTVFDPACGSGAFLVEAFKEIVKNNKAEHDYEKKVKILENQVFGIDVDKQALQIATFSLYLALLEREEPADIQEKIRNAYPILPSLINRTLIKGNSLVDDIYPDRTFDCIVANPPWGSVPTERDGDEENERERNAIGKKGKVGSIDKKQGEIKTFPEYKNVSDYQRSQAFLLKINTWCHKGTLCSLIVNNPIFLNEKAEDFRKELLNTYRITHFYELSHLNKILFKKRIIGKIRVNGKEESVEIGASEPCVVLVFDKKDVENNTIHYISPKLTKFSEAFELIHYTQKDIKTVKQKDLQHEDCWLWRIFVDGFWDDYQLIKRKYVERHKVTIQCRSGFKPEKNAKRLGEPQLRDLITPKHFDRYVIYKEFEKFDWNQTLERRRKKEIFHGKRILIPVRPSKKDKLKLRGIRIEGDQVHKDDITSLKILEDNKPIEDYATYLGILNSQFIGYYVYQISAQWGKGEMKRPKLRNADLEGFLPFPKINYTDARIAKLTKLVNQIEQNKKEHKETQKFENQIDELVFDLYDLLEYEKEMIREFYQVNVEREGEIVRQDDLQQYVDKFRNVFSFILAEHLALNVTYRISSNLGAYVGFTIVKKEEMIPEVKLDRTTDRQLLDIVKQKQLSQTLFSRRLNEDKVKIYNENKFFIIKSNYFKDWTVRQAMNDANEEIGLIMQDLPEE